MSTFDVKGAVQVPAVGAKVVHPTPVQGAYQQEEQDKYENTA